MGSDEVHSIGWNPIRHCYEVFTNKGIRVMRIHLASNIPQCLLRAGITKVEFSELAAAQVLAENELNKADNS